MTLYYEEHGYTEGSLIVFLHGGGVSGWMWDQQLEYFHDYHCIVPDLPEQGRSKGEEKFSIRSSAEKIIDLIEDKGKGKQVILIGFSLGAQITIQIVSMKPGLIDCAIINSALIKPMPLGWKFLKPFVKLSHPLTKWKTFSKLQAKVLYIPENDFEKYYQETCDMEVETLIRILEENMSFKVPSDFKLASSNMLVTVGENENKLMKKSAKDIVNSNLNCHGVLISGVGHGLPLANPQLFNKMVKDWIEKHSNMEDEKFTSIP
ncbi:hydrolase [Siminovitchia terrae]|uniref:alpha/beta fold hydrolase n=1 Tax=Siminovitchia terrae TaxID=1914933 RepID=UPI001B115B45|nr:alpha/beta hydrolase [Siminovitchia terrae]GIN92640.1 hydrolase [Siminovitchia terrae]